MMTPRCFARLALENGARRRTFHRPLHDSFVEPE
jgi:hypothetical protein